MSLGGLIPITGAGSGSSGAGNAKKVNDLTSGLISISGQKGGTADIDMSDFDVDDLLTEGTTTSSSSKKKSAKVSSSSPQKDAKKKKSSKSKDKDAKKKKKKDDLITAFSESSDRFDDDDDNEDDEKGWSSKTKDAAKSSRWGDDSSDFAIGGGQKKMGNLDAEFAKMLGLEEDFAAATSSGDAQTHEDVTPFSDDTDHPSGNSVGEDTFSYAPRVRGGHDDGKKREEKGGVAPFSNDSDLRGGASKTYSDPFGAGSSTGGGGGGGGSVESGAIGGLSASFFVEDEVGATAKGEDYSSLSFLSSATERRGGRGGRRGGGAVFSSSAIEDPFASIGSGRGNRGGDKPDLDSLFGGGGASREMGDLFSSQADKPAALERTRRADAEREEKAGKENEKDVLVVRKTISSAPDLSKAKDDLLSELFPSEPRVRNNRDSRKEPSPKQEPTRSLGSAKGDLLAELFPADPPPKQQQPRQTESFQRDTVDEEEKKHAPQGKQQDDLLAELFPTTKPKARISFDDPRDDEESTVLVEKRRETRDRDTFTPPKLQSKPVERQPQKTTTLNDISSAKASLLMDLFPDSPPQKQPREGRRNSRTSTPSASPVKEAPPTDERETGNSYLRATSSSPQKSPLRVVEQSPIRSTISLSKDPPRQQPQVSPGRAKTLASPSASSIKEADFEQSKDSLLEELFSPPSPGNTGQTRRDSYSQSFEDEKSDLVVDEHSPRRHHSSSATNASSPSKSPEKRSRESPMRAASSSSVPLLQEVDDLRSTANPRVHSGAASIVQRETQVGRATSTQSPVPDAQVSSATLASALKARENELLAEADAAKAMLVATHASEIARLHELIDSLTQQLSGEKAKNLALSCEHDHQLAKLRLMEQETQAFMQQIQGLQSEKQQLQQELSLTQAQHALCANQSALFQAERTGFTNQMKNLEDQNRQLLRQFTQERQDHQATMLKFTSFQQEREQEAQLQKQKESHQMGKLFQQLQTSLLSLKMLQEQVVEEEITKHEVENESRLRMITSLETSSRRSARQTEEECIRLSSLLNSLETTLRHYRQEHLEEKERLRQEQLRLNVLATHFQAQTTVMHEKADANTQMLAQYFTSSMQDVRVAESRLAVRRQTLEDEEKQLYDERTKFAVYREEFLQQQARETNKLHADRIQLDAKWKELVQEREDLEDVIAAHEDEFQFLQQQKRELDEEKENVEYRARQVAEMAAKVKLLTQQMVAREEELAKAHQEMDASKQDFVYKQQSVTDAKKKLDERELRLHTQLKQMEKSQNRLNDQRRQHLILSATKAGPASPGERIGPGQAAADALHTQHVTLTTIGNGEL
uniref:Fas-binding factor 1 n=1 Tax=Globisporangium ultimum (strain ATCC 200006 / CBS 805.95 / DAOM BR144) TaxID=431595 RepID=K3X7F3_GLOUD